LPAKKNSHSRKKKNSRSVRTRSPSCERQHRDKRIAFLTASEKVFMALGGGGKRTGRPEGNDRYNISGILLKMPERQYLSRGTQRGVVTPCLGKQMFSKMCLLREKKKPPKGSSRNTNLKQIRKKVYCGCFRRGYSLRRKCKKEHVGRDPDRKKKKSPLFSWLQ